MEPEGSLPCSLQPTNDLYTEPDESTPHSPIPYLLRSFITSSSHECVSIPKGLFPSGFPTENLYKILSVLVHATCHVERMLHDLIRAHNPS
jgi:hypothetical protein